MSNYTVTTDFTAKDSLPSGNAGKVIKGSEFDTEFDNIATAIATKADTASPTLTGTPAAPTAAADTNTTQIATTAYVQTELLNLSGTNVTSGTVPLARLPAIPVARSTTATTLAVGDVGKCVAVSAGITVPNSTFAAGDSVSIYNDSASPVTVTQGSGLTLRRAGSTSTGNRTLAARGLATVWFNTASEAIISGAGLS